MSPASGDAQCVDLIISKQLEEYGPSMRRMHALQQDVENGANHKIWMLEHSPVYTIGRSGVESEVFVEAADVYHAQRGGKTTYHGPGQRICYIMLDLKRIYRQPDAHAYLRTLEVVISASLKQLSIEAFTKAGLTGVWVKNKNMEDAKICAIGIHIKKWVTSHGFALNINPDLSMYQNIVPCGITEYEVTSLNKLGIDIELSRMDAILMDAIQEKFNLVLEATHVLTT